MRMLAAVTAVLVILASAPLCQAASLERGGYMSGFMGVSGFKDTSVRSEEFSSGSVYNDRVKFDPGFSTGITGGYNFGFFRLEGELSYKSAQIDEITDQTDNYRFGNVDGDLAALAMMCNGFFDLRNDSPVTPYFGGGVGLATLYLSDTYGTDTRGGGGATRALLYREDNDTVFAYQVGGGLEIALNSVLSLDLGYRYFTTATAEFEGDWDNRTELKLKSHNVSAGLRVRF